MTTHPQLGTEPAPPPGAGAAGHALVRRLREDLQRFSGAAEIADDITLLAVRWNGV